MQAPTKEQLKERAKHLCEIMLEKYSVKVKHGHSLEIVSRLFGVKDWNTASALSAEVNIAKPVTEKSVANSSSEKPIAAKLPTAGELADFFAKFDRDTKVYVNEYRGSNLSEVDSLSNWNSLSGTMTSICSLTYDSEIQKGIDVHLELNTEDERDYQLKDFGHSANQSFDKTTAGRSQRRVKYLNMLNGFWNPQFRRDQGTNSKS
ncbi:MAG: hypothetical protein J0M15_16010 [Deltaproteobacteria bacterium]|nr:hypothetical protein [Deltaproteobacteria bacterium]